MKIRDPVEKELLDVLRLCVTKLTEMNLEAHGPHGLPLPLIEVVRAEEVIERFTGDMPRMTVSEGAAYDALRSAMSRFENYADEVTRVARTPDQVRVADNFGQYVTELGESLFGKPPRKAIKEIGFEM